MKYGLKCLSYCLHAIVLGVLVGCGARDPMEAGVAAINAGQLQKARTIFEKIATDKAATSLNRAVAYKHLGTIQFRFGEDPTEAFKNSEEWFDKVLGNQPSQDAREQYGFMLYQKANYLLSAYERQLSRDKITGVQASPFSYMNNYLHPAGASLQKAKDFYPASQAADLGLLEIELFLTESHMWQACYQQEPAMVAINKAIALADVTLKQSSIAPDTRMKLLLRKAQLLLEKSPEAPPHDVVRGILEDARKSSSGNAELDLSVFTFYIKYLLRYNLLKAEKDFDKIECDIRTAVEKLEKLRADNLSDMDFTTRKNYFASRTELYEALVMLYAKRSRPFDMLLALNQIRSRAMQDSIEKAKITSMEQLQRILAENKGMLIAYYVGAEHIWSVRISGSDAKISCSEYSGQELVAACWEVWKISSSVKCLEAYVKRGYEGVPFAYFLSNKIYQDIFEECHKAFLAQQCKHLYIMPNHVLNYLPFSTLVVNFDTQNLFNSRLVADDALPITYLPSMNCLVPALRTSHGTENLILARAYYNYPVFCTNDPQNPENPNGKPQNLENVVIEAEAIAKLLKVNEDCIFREKKASEYNLTKMLSTPKNVVHVASHAALNPLNPLESFLVLAAGQGEDGKLSVGELLSKHQGRFNVELLVLSACDTNRGEIRLLPGDDIAALSNAFMVAGCRNVISTQWPASDATFPIIMGILHYNLSNGMAKDAALAAALKAFRDQAKSTQGQELLLHPLFWGNVVLSGEKQ